MAGDDNGHGTHVAGIAVARAGDSVGVAGVAPNALVLPVKVLKKDGSGVDGPDALFGAGRLNAARAVAG